MRKRHRAQTATGQQELGPRDLGGGGGYLFSGNFGALVINSGDLGSKLIVLRI